MTGEKRRILFIDRDGTLITEPPDQQVDSLEKLGLVPGVIPALLKLAEAGYEFVIVSNQDGLGTEAYPFEDFEPPQRKMLELFASQGIEFSDVLIDEHFEHEDSPCRKPGIGMVLPYLKSGELDLEDSWVIGDRETDLELAENMGIGGFRLQPGPETWESIAHHLLNRPRQARVKRETRETDIQVFVDLDAPGTSEVSTGIGFFDHMLDQLASHGGFRLELQCKGDLEIDEHHTVEDCALALGQALNQALGDRRGIGRYGFCLPMDESLAQVAIDLSGRPAMQFEAAFPRDSVGNLSTEMVRHFFQSLSQKLGAAIHVQVSGENTHHMVEAVFKSAGRALRPALERQGREMPSTKGVL
ncbi:MAG: bifunctional histidinol-phosphatase/imidazoleglycerol-phosphate dehydratase HisB [Xanthomonadales bacterium]|jgi:imidazoleglycerol-phosphate dehydratase/histidinol-phosphatase|nr:bifunctional histidinol-phosphatase/imidazoleglycerol-phosphate dehydratase HisB [Xanthomonadales bacterium]